MVLKTIYIVRHGFRSNWVVNHNTGEYTHTFPTPTGIPSDPSLASHGVEQAQELATHLLSQKPRIGAIYSSPFYRCLQTISPTVSLLNKDNISGSGNGQGSGEGLKVRTDTGLGEFYGLARFDHPIPATTSVLSTHFPNLLDEKYKSPVIPAANGESVDGLHDRVAQAIEGIIARCDEEGIESVVFCTHAAVMICAGRVLTGNMPEDYGVEDFRCGTCSFSRFERRSEGAGQGGEWRGKGVKGGWECKVNGDCSFLTGGEERTWCFAMEENYVNPAAHAG